MGTGTVRQIEVNQLWLQDKVYNGEVVLNKVRTDENIADAMTKAVTAGTLGFHVDGSGGTRRRYRHWMAPEITEKKIAMKKRNGLSQRLQRSETIEVNGAPLKQCRRNC